MNAVVFVAAIVAVVIALTVLGRASGRKKRIAREDLKREQEQIGRFDILDLVREEVAETGVAELPGSEGIDPSVLLRVWQRDEDVRARCAGRDFLRIVVDDGVHPGDAALETVRLVCDQEEPRAEADDRAEVPGEGEQEAAADQGDSAAPRADEALDPAESESTKES